MKIVHISRLRSMGGVQRLLTSYLCQTAEITDNEQLLITGSKLHPFVEQRLNGLQIPMFYFAKVGFLPLPKRPGFLRRLRLESILRRIRPDVLLMWDYAKDFQVVESAKRLGAKVIYYDHGGCFGAGSRDQFYRVFSGVDGIICNSLAAKRILEEKWKFEKPIMVCPNAMQAELTPDAVEAKSFPVDRPFRLGVAGRIESGKGFGLVIRALEMLRRRGRNVELYLAGDGRQRSQLEGLSRELGLGESCHFLGMTQDMAAFYRMIDCCVVPSVNESFGMVSIEAQAYGNAVIASGVDGLAETIIHNETGYLIRPTLSVDAFPDLAGIAAQNDRYQYDPYDDRVVMTLRVPDPEQICETVDSLLADPGTFEAVSRRASERALHDYAFDRMITELGEAVEGICASRPAEKRA